MSHLPVIAITAGDVAGIGPEILVSAVHSPAITHACLPLAICHSHVLRRAVDLVGLNVCVQDFGSHGELPTESALRTALTHAARAAQPTILCWNPAGDAAATAAPRQVSAAAGDSAFRYLSAAIELAQANVVDAIATAPLNKAALHAAGHDFPGHTEILAEKCSVRDFAMMLHLPESRTAPLRKLIRSQGAAESDLKHGLSIVHVTLHTSIASVPALLTASGIAEKTRLMHGFLKRIGCKRAAIGVCALNPHGGENGLFGNEEQAVIAPAVNSFAGSDVNAAGPFPVDTLIRRAVSGEFDGVVAMYHDQGHIPVKLMGFDAAVNITLGLPLIRTSPTHGTAFDRAWSPNTPADPAGMIEAILTATRLSRASHS